VVIDDPVVLIDNWSNGVVVCMGLTSCAYCDIMYIAFAAIEFERHEYERNDIHCGK